MSPIPIEGRGFAAGTRQILRFNRHWYAAALLTLLASAWVARVATAPSHGLAARLVLLCTAWWTLASVAGSYWIYDVAKLNSWLWLRGHISPPRSGGRWLNVHAGFDTATVALRRLLPSEEAATLALDAPGGPETPSLRRALATLEDTTSPRVSVVRFPHPSASLDRVFFLQTAHERRRPADRRALFREAARVLRPGGELVVAEHGRDLPNALLWGPGLFHQYPVREWLRCAKQAGLSISHHGRRTPFVHLLVFRRSG